MYRKIGANPAIDLFVHLRQFRGGQCARTGKVEAQAFWLDQRAALLHLGAEQIAQRAVQQVSGAMVAYSIFAALRENIGLRAVAHAHISLANLTIMRNQSLERAA